ncbi:hypothetical protein M885DRAFT_537452 [Pelagophyceae sp. CCMP2097]|nr:hypothetical protein M885DRAFT_537452 [Pelagophyceae sp. CCMP2097]
MVLLLLVGPAVARRRLRRRPIGGGVGGAAVAVANFFLVDARVRLGSSVVLVDEVAVGLGLGLGIDLSVGVVSGLFLCEDRTQREDDRLEESDELAAFHALRVRFVEALRAQEPSSAFQLRPRPDGFGVERGFELFEDVLHAGGVEGAVARTAEGGNDVAVAQDGDGFWDDVVHRRGVVDVASIAAVFPRAYVKVSERRLGDHESGVADFRRDVEWNVDAVHGVVVRAPSLGDANPMALVEVLGGQRDVETLHSWVSPTTRASHAFDVLEGCVRGLVKASDGGDLVTFGDDSELLDVIEDAIAANVDRLLRHASYPDFERIL